MNTASVPQLLLECDSIFDTIHDVVYGCKWSCRRIELNFGCEVFWRARRVKDPVAQKDRALASYPKVASSILAGVTTLASFDKTFVM